MIYFNSDNLADDLLKKVMSPDIINESSEYIEGQAKIYGVDPKDIIKPAPYLISRLAESYAYMTAARLSARFTKGDDATKDAFSLKYTMYKGIVDSLERQLNAGVFTGGATEKRRTFPMTVHLYRR